MKSSDFEPQRRQPPALEAWPVKTRVFKLGEDLASFVFEHLDASQVEEGAIIAITSKIVSLSERAVISKKSVSSKIDLVRRESDHFLAESAYGTALTIKHGILIPAAGIDESNAEGEVYILFPKDPYASAKALHAKLCAHFGRKKLGLVITDSHTHPLRRGVIGIGLSHWGFRATRDLVGKPDLFGRTLKMTHVDVLDSVAMAAVYAMGESNECTPIAIVKSSGVEFGLGADPASEIRIEPEVDLYGPLIQPFLGS